MAELGLGDAFEHEIDKDGTNMEVTIRNSTGSRKLYFHLRHGLVGATPWPIGPVSLFYPKPEPIPAGELAALRKTAVGAVTSGSPDGGGKGAASTSANDSADASPGGKHWWPWITAGLVLGMMAVLAVVACLKRRTHGSSR